MNIMNTYNQKLYGNYTEKKMKAKSENIFICDEIIRSMFNSTNDFIAFLSPEGNFVMINPAFEKLTGWKQNEILGKNVRDFVHIKDVAKIKKRVELLRKGENVAANEARVLTKSGEYINIETISSPVYRNEENIGFISVGRDMSERKKLLSELENKNKEHKFLLENISDVILKTDLLGNITYVTPSIEQMSGYSMKEALALNLKDVLVEEDYTSTMEIVNNRQKTGKKGAIYIEVRHKGKDGSLKWCEVIARFFFEKKGAPEGIIASIRDITTRKNAEDKLFAMVSELQEAQVKLKNLHSYLEVVREEERNHISRDIHDELGQSLTSLKMELSWIGRNMPAKDDRIEEKIHDMLEAIDNAINSMRRICSQLRPKVLDDLGLAAATEWFCERFAKRMGIRCDLIMEPPDMELPSDLSVTIFRIIQEALTNVERHSNATRVKLKIKKGRGSVEMNVEDNGKGITDQQINSENSLGLIGMWERINRLGGALKVEGKKHKGTSIDIKIPVC